MDLITARIIFVGRKSVGLLLHLPSPDCRKNLVFMRYEKPVCMYSMGIYIDLICNYCLLLHRKRVKRVLYGF